MSSAQPQGEVAVHAEPFDRAALERQLRDAGAATGAVVTFTGLVRELVDHQLLAMELEHYPGMTEKALAAIVTQARRRWPLQQVLVRHRVGRLLPAEEIVFVGVASAHRQAAFEATQFIMDYLKRDAPFWKKEILSTGAHWVEQKQSDLSAAATWGDSGGSES